MARTLHVAILRNAALLVPAPARAEWLAEWRAELWYVEHDATAFCLGSFRDALWLRIKSFDARSALSLDSPLRCVLFLTVSAGLVFLLGGRADGLSLRFQGPEGLSVGLFWMYFESLLVLLTLNPLVLGEYPQNARAPSLLIRLRRWVFLAIKIALLPPILFLATAAVARIFPPAAGILFIGLIVGLRWVLADQRRRCPVCLHFLSNPVELRGHTHMVFQPHGTELRCARGHGSLYVPDTPTSWCEKQRWQYMCIPPLGGRRG
jgi:hypothetical protein